MAPPRLDLAKTLRDNSRADPSGCVIWTGPLHYKGYGRLAKAGKAHRVAYELAKGAIAAGAHVLHRCDNRACINPDHLYLGTNSENIDDKCRRDRSGKKLNKEKVLAMRGLSRLGMRQADIAQLFGVNRSNVSRAVSGKRWAHVEIA